MGFAQLYPPFAEAALDIELSATQVQAIELVLLGYNNRQIAKALGWSYAQVQSATLKAFAKAGAPNRTTFVAMVYSGAVRVWVPA